VKPETSGQATVEAALALGILLVLLGGVMAGALLLYQYEAVTNGARAGARAAIVEAPLLRPGPDGLCEPGAILRAVTAAVATVPVSAAPLCQSGDDPNELVQSGAAPGQATVTVTGSPELSPAAGNQITVTVALPVRVPPPLIPGALTLQASATLSTQ
jgi:hypothetical protein